MRPKPMKKQRTLKSNPVFRENVLTRLKNSSSGIIEICAADFDLDYETFVSQLDDVMNDGFVSPVNECFVPFLSVMKKFAIGFVRKRIGGKNGKRRYRQRDGGTPRAT